LKNSHNKGNLKMKRFNPETKTFRVFNALYNGQTLTASKAKHDLGVGNLSAEASRIRAAGYAVYSNSRTAGNGVQVTEYAMGKPSREIVALGYKAKAMGITL
jgi:Helix-turn-helix domain